MYACCLIFDDYRPNCLQIILRGLNQVSYYYICADNPDLALVGKFGLSSICVKLPNFDNNICKYVICLSLWHDYNNQIC